jgi:hypothetical protein
LSEGQVKNFDTPRNLLLDKTSVLFELISKMPKNERKSLFDIVNNNNNNNNNNQQQQQIEINNIMVHESTTTTKSYVNYGATINE